MSLPWFPFFVDDFLASPKVRRMNADEIGVYTLLLCEQWQTGIVAGDPAELATMVKSTPASVEKVLESCFNRRGKGWVNLRLVRVKAEQDAKSAKARAAAEARWENVSNADAGADAMPEGCHPEPEPEADRKNTSDSAFEEVWALHRKGPKPQARDAYRRAVPYRITHPDLLTALRRYTASFKGDFTGAHLFRWIRDSRWEELSGNGSHPKREILT